MSLSKFLFLVTKTVLCISLGILSLILLALFMQTLGLLVLRLFM